MVHVEIFNHAQQSAFLKAISRSVLNESQKYILTLNIYPKLLELQDALSHHGEVSFLSIGNNAPLKAIPESAYREVAGKGGDVLIECNLGLTRFYSVVGIEAPFISFEEGTWHNTDNKSVEETHQGLEAIARELILDDFIFSNEDTDENAPFRKFADEVMALPDFKSLLFDDFHVVFSDWKEYLPYFQSPELRNSIEQRILHKKQMTDAFRRNLKNISNYLESYALDNLLELESHDACIPKGADVSYPFEPLNHCASQATSIITFLNRRFKVNPFVEFDLQRYTVDMETSFRNMIRKRLHYWKMEYAPLER